MLNNTLTNWSFKKLKMWRACPYSVYLKYIVRAPEPEPNPKYEEKRLRGINAHDFLEEIVNNGHSAKPDVLNKPDVVEFAKQLHALGAQAERDEYFDRKWQPMTPKLSANGYPLDHWLVVKKDYRLKTEDYVLVGDWKTGKKYGNELDHMEQMKLYALSEFVKDPGYPEYCVELQYLDQDETWSHAFKPAELERYWRDFDIDVEKMMTDKIFRPKPNIYNCRYCPFNKKNGSAACPVAAL